MKDWQWCTMMWMLSMICFYVSGKLWEPLIVAFVFIACGCVLLARELFK